ncbi:hypothetical protein [Hyunsoonleella rubra]|uniref:Thrombospondin type 3 repeat-containing protein n=1 Tax=Hyunsoonleella rubra TaxID=1737062 RepID=A0ABW5TG55_9FLAO
MRKLVVVFSILSLLLPMSCDDGDVFEVELDFENEYDACGESDLVLYKTKEDPTETLSVLITNYTIAKAFDEDANDTIEKTGAFFYRTYGRPDLPSDLFCTNIPPANLNIATNETSSCGVTFIRTLVEDDDDGIDPEFEDLNGNGNLEDDDTDGDGIPNYLDEDDDGDNVFTKNENPDPNGDGDPADAQNTNSDQDELPDYLDPDDDGDGTLTRDEENDSQNQEPADDVTFPDVGPDYLNPSLSTKVDAKAYREHTIKQTYTLRMTVTEISLSILLQDSLDFGFFSGTKGFNLNNERTVTPTFP